MGARRITRLGAVATKRRAAEVMQRGGAGAEAVIISPEFMVLLHLLLCVLEMARRNLTIGASGECLCRRYRWIEPGLLTLPPEGPLRAPELSLFPFLLLVGPASPLDSNSAVVASFPCKLLLLCLLWPCLLCLALLPDLLSF